MCKIQDNENKLSFGTTSYIKYLHSHQRMPRTRYAALTIVWSTFQHLVKMMIQHCPISSSTAILQVTEPLAVSVGMCFVGILALSQQPFPKLKRDHHYCRVGFLVQWSAHCEIQKTSATVFPVLFFFFSPPPLAVVLLSYKELLLLCFLSTVKVRL